MAIKQFEQASLYQEQYKIIKESAENEDLANEIAGRIGIKPEMYKQVLTRALNYHEKYEKRASETFHYWEIGGEQSIGVGPVRDNNQSKIKTKAIINGKRKAYNAVEEVVQWRKFEKIKDMLLQAI